MKNLQLKLSIICFWFTAGVFAQNPALTGQDTTSRPLVSAVPYLNIAADARSAALGEAVVALDNGAFSTFWNPAQMAFAEQTSSIALSYTPWLRRLAKDMSLAYLTGYFKPDDAQGWGFSLNYFDQGEVQLKDRNNSSMGSYNPFEIALAVSYGRQLSDHWSIGGSLRFIHSNLYGNLSIGNITAQPGTAMSGDVGVFYQSKKPARNRKGTSLSAAAVISNFGNKMNYGAGERYFIPTKLNLGMAFKQHLQEHQINWLLSIQKLMVPTPPLFASENGNVVRNNDGRPMILKGKDPNRNLFSGVFGSFTDAPGGLQEELREFLVSAGVEYWYNELLAARVGYFNESRTKGDRKMITSGVGLHFQNIGFDFAYLVPLRQNSPLAETLRFSLAYNLEGNDERRKLFNIRRRKNRNR